MTNTYVQSSNMSDDEYEEIEDTILIEFEGALDRQFLRDEKNPLVITQLIDKPFMSVGPLSFEGKYEHMPHTSLIYTMPQKSNKSETDRANLNEEAQFVTACTRRIAMKRVLLVPKDQNSRTDSNKQQQQNSQSETLSTAKVSNLTVSDVSEQNSTAAGDQI